MKLYSNIFIEENAFENVVGNISSILSWPPCLWEPFSCVCPKFSSRCRMPVWRWLTNTSLLYTYRISSLGGAKWFNNILRPGWHGCHFADIFKFIFLYENCVLIKISLKFVRQGSIDKEVSICAKQATNYYLNQWWLSLLMRTCICVIQPQCVVYAVNIIHI